MELDIEAGGYIRIIVLQAVQDFQSYHSKEAVSCTAAILCLFKFLNSNLDPRRVRSHGFTTAAGSCPKRF